MKAGASRPDDGRWARASPQRTAPSPDVAMMRREAEYAVAMSLAASTHRKTTLLRLSARHPPHLRGANRSTRFAPGRETDGAWAQNFPDDTSLFGNRSGAEARARTTMQTSTPASAAGVTSLPARPAPPARCASAPPRQSPTSSSPRRKPRDRPRPPHAAGLRRAACPWPG